MGNIHKIGDEYYVEFMARGLKYQQKAGKDLKKAEELLHQIEEKIAKGELQTIVREIALDVFFAEFIKYAQSQYHTHTVRRLSLAIAHFEKFVKSKVPEVRKLSQVTPRVMEDYKTAHIQQRSAGGLNPKIVNLTLLLLREILEYGIKTGYINDNPTLHIKLLDVPPRSLIIAEDALLKILENSKEPHRSIFIFLRHTGLRLSELENFNWQQVDFNRNVIFIKYREIPLSASALAVLKTAFNNVIDYKAPVFIDSEGRAPQAAEIEIRFNKAVAKSGLLSAVTAAYLRHTFACELLRTKLSFLAIGKILGIHDAAKLMIYASCIPTSREDIFTGIYGA
jgi:site-specific recombinase XerD